MNLKVVPSLLTKLVLRPLARAEAVDLAVVAVAAAEIVAVAGISLTVEHFVSKCLKSWASRRPKGEASWRTS